MIFKQFFWKYLKMCHLRRPAVDWTESLDNYISGGTRYTRRARGVVIFRWRKHLKVVDGAENQLGLTCLWRLIVTHLKA